MFFETLIFAYCPKKLPCLFLDSDPATAIVDESPLVAQARAKYEAKKKYCKELNSEGGGGMWGFSLGEAHMELDGLKRELDAAIEAYEAEKAADASKQKK